MLLGLAIGMALADSSVVTLALPDVLREFDVEITTVAWVLTSYNLVLALLAVPAAFVARRRPGARVRRGDAGLRRRLARPVGWHRRSACWWRRAACRRPEARFVITAALDLLSERRGQRRSRDADLGLPPACSAPAIGPAVGGVLTQTIGWEWIFLLQAPLALVPLLAARGGIGRAPPAAGPQAGRACPPTSGCCSSPAGWSRRSS